MQQSDKKYGVAVALAGVFGLLGIHHFYLGRWLHGCIDLTATLIGLALIHMDKEILGWSILTLDYIHTMIIMILLLIGAYKDSQGEIVAYPGQTLKK